MLSFAQLFSAFFCISTVPEKPVELLAREHCNYHSELSQAKAIVCACEQGNPAALEFYLQYTSIDIDRDDAKELYTIATQTKDSDIRSSMQSIIVQHTPLQLHDIQ